MPAIKKVARITGRLLSKKTVNPKNTTKDTIERSACGRRTKTTEKNTYGITRKNKT